ncbi:MAG: STAS domain-containing protein [Planctomycetota bacterium]
MPITEWSDDVLLVDLGSEPQLSEDLSGTQQMVDGLGATPRHIVLDMHEVHMLTSTNIAALLRLRKMQKLAKRRLVVARVPNRVWAIFLTAGLEEMFETSSDVGTALAAVQLGIR